MEVSGNSPNKLPNHTLLIKSVLCIAALIGIISNVLIVTVFVKFVKNCNHYNVYLISWSISNSIFLISTLFLCYFESQICYVIFTGILFLAANLFFVAILLLDRLIASFCSINYVTNCIIFSRFINFVAWILVLVFLLNIFVFCNNKIQLYVTLILMVCSTILVCFVGICIHFLRFVKRKTASVAGNSLVLTLVSSFIFGWLPTCLYFIYAFVKGTIIESMLVVCFSIGQTNSLVVLLLLYRYDEHFKIGFRAFSRCKEEDNEKNADLEK